MHSVSTPPEPQAAVRPITVLMVEDDPDDVYLTQEALRSGRLQITMQVVSDGASAMQYLRGEQEYAGSRRPDLVLLDLNLPRMDGREVLAAIKEDPEFSDIPVVILTTSEAEEDIASSYRHHANCYISKPVGIDKFRSVVGSIESFWFTIVKLPPDNTH